MTQLKGCDRAKGGIAIALSLLIACFFWGEKTKAQIVPDSTLPNNSTVTSFGPFNTINGGTRAGDNLFHSFSEFSLSAFRTAFFNNAADIANIFSRVTGSNPSNINGIITTNGSANLFFLNPNGIIFGPNVQLLIGGSLISTTANAIGFGDRGIFSATVPNDPSLLTIQPSFFQYDGAVAQPANSIEVRGYLKVDPGNSILLVGGTGSILVDGTINSDPTTGFIEAPDGKIEIGGLSAPGRIGLERDGNNPRLMSLNFPQGVEKSDVSIINRGTVATRGDNGGAIAISARRLNVRESGIVSAANNASFLGARVGDIALKATEITLESSTLSNGISPGVTGNGGNINIAAQRLNVLGGTNIVAVTAGAGNAGNIAITVGESLNLSGRNSDRSPNVIASGAVRGSEGNGGNVEITAGSVQMTDGAQIGAVTSGLGNSGNINIETGTLDLTKGAAIDASTGGQGNGGNVRIAARERINLDGEEGRLVSAIGSAVFIGAEGNAGSVEIATGTLNITNGAGIIASTGGRGNAGNVKVAATDSINMDGEGSFSVSQISSLTLSGAVGNGGNVEITTGTLNITNGAGIDTRTEGQGNAGNITVVARERIHLAGEGRFAPSTIFSPVAPGAVGNGGTLDLTTQNLRLTDGAQISTSVLGEGNAGTVRIVASERIDLDGWGKLGASGINSALLQGGVGNGGNIDIDTGTLNITDGAQIVTSTVGRGNAGNVRVAASNEINLDGQPLRTQGPTASLIISSVLPGAVGNGGNIDLDTGTLNITDGGLVSAETYGQGNGGNVAIVANDRVTVDGYRFFPSAIATSVNPGAVGNGGNIEVSTGTLEVTNGGTVRASTFGRGDGGDIAIAARERVNLDGSSALGSSSIDSSVQASGVGNGGNIEVSTGTLDVKNGAQIQATTSGQGNGGNIEVTARGPEGNREAGRVTLDGYSLNGSGIGTSVNPGGVGKGGDITLAASSIEITNRAFISADNFGVGDAGDIVQIAARTLYLDNGSITTQSPSGNGGNIRNLQIQDLLLMRNGSQISTTAGTQQSGGGNGGNINIDAGFVVAVPRENSDITANAFAGNGGNINISTSGIFGFSVQRFLTPRSDITASSQLGINGTINILTLGIDPNRGLVPPPLTPGAPDLPQSCQANAAQGGSRFIESDRGGLPPNPQEALGSSSLWSDARTSPSAANINPEAEPSGEIVEARGWVRGANGTAILVGNAPTNSSVAIAGCYKR